MTGPGERTAEEREAARREREERRVARAAAERDGTSAPDRGGPKLPRLKLPSLKLPQLGRDRDEQPAEDPAPPAPPPRSVVSPPPPTAPPPPTVARPPAPAPKRPPVPRAAARPPTKRLPRPGAPSGGPPPTAPPGAGGPSEPSRSPTDGEPPRRRVGRRLAVVGVIAALFGVFALWFLISLFQPFAGDGEGRVRVTIPAGTGIGEVADLLKKEGVIGSTFFFELRARTTGQGGDVKQGTFTLRRDMSYTAALDAITASPKADVVNVTIPEGRSRREVAPTVREAGLKGNYARLTRRSSTLNPRTYGARGATSLEGFLFPSTYELKKGATARTLVRDQLDTFKREFRKVDLRAARRRNLTPYDVLIIASMVDRETLLARERPIVASVIHNRLRDGIPLGIDATIRFATNNWTRPLRESELAIASPYNTRENQGLPPGPIGSPGLDAIKAAANPARTKYLYYVVKPGTCGEHAFSATDAQFQRDVERYNSEREARGESPDTCPE